MKKNRTYGLMDKIGLLKMIKMMRFTIIILLLSLSQTFAVNSYSQQAKLSLDMRNVRLEDVLDRIEKNTEFFFMYNKNMIDVDRKVDIQVEERNVNEVLNKIFANTNISYTIKDRQILLINNRMSDTGNESITQQQKSISGKVIDSSGGSLPGVSVVVKGTTTGVITDMDGNYTLPKVPENATLQFSFVGMKMQEVKVSGKSVINVTMVEETIGLEEVVAVGYGTRTKRELTQAISSVKGSSIENIPVSSAVAMLQGRASGVQIIQNSGAPGGTDMTIRVRGITSINAGNDPLYIVDGMQITGGTSDISPNDIESMDILKDAAATAIYGSRGANGVILITTKRGKDGKAKINFNHYSAINQINYNRIPKLLNADQFIEEVQEQQANSNSSRQPYGFIYDGGGDTNWLKQLLQTGEIENTDLSISGGDKKIQFYLGGSIFDQKGILIKTGYKRYTGKLNVDYQATDKFKLGVNLNYSNNITLSSVGEMGPFQVALFKSPTMPVYNPDGSYYFNDPSGQMQPVASINETKSVTQANRLIGNMYGEYRILKDLLFKTTWGVDINNSRYNYFAPSTASASNPATGSASYTLNNNWVNENTLNYNTTFKLHKITSLLGYSQLENRMEVYNLAAKDYATDNVSTLNAAVTPTLASTEKQANGMSSLFGRIGYSFNDKYYSEASLRRDGSSKFGSNSKFALFPAASVGWRISNEKFFSGLTSIINDLKLRMSYGKTGNQSGIGNYTWQGLYTTGSGYIGKNGIAYTSIANTNLKWETTDQYNLGTDISLLKDRIRLNVDLYLKKTNDLLLNVPLPSTSGFGSALKNIGSTQNKGLEFTINTVNIKAENFRWTSNLNITFNKNKVVKLYNGQRIIASRGQSAILGQNQAMFLIEEGQPIGQFFGWESKGVYANSSDNTTGLRNSNSSGYVFRGGDMKFVDQNGDNVINDDDRVVIGNANPLFTGGFSNNFKYKNFELDVLTQFSYGNQIYNGTRAITEAMYQFGNMSTGVLNHWRKEGDITDVPINDNDDYAGNRRASQRWIEDGSYLRIKTVTLSYNFPKTLLGKAKIQTIRLYVTGQNLLTFTNYTGIDPEASFNNSAVTDMGFDYAVYPQYRTFLFGVNIGF